MRSSHTRVVALALVLVAIFAQLTSASSASILVSAHASEPFVRAGEAFTLSCAVRVTGLSASLHSGADRSTMAPPRPAASMWSWGPLSAAGAAGPRAKASSSFSGRTDETRRSRWRRSIRRRRCSLVPRLCAEYDENYNFTESAQKFMKRMASITPPPESEFYQPMSRWKAVLQTPRPSTQRPKPSERLSAQPRSYVNVSVVNGLTELVRVRVRARNVWMHDERLTMDVVFPLEEQRMRVLPKFANIDTARLEEFEVRSCGHRSQNSVQ